MMPNVYKGGEVIVLTTRQVDGTRIESVVLANDAYESIDLDEALAKYGAKYGKPNNFDAYYMQGDAPNFVDWLVDNAYVVRQAYAHIEIGDEFTTHLERKGAEDG